MPVYALVKLSDHARRNAPFEIGDRLDEHFDSDMIETLIARGEATRDEQALAIRDGSLREVSARECARGSG